MVAATSVARLVGESTYVQVVPRISLPSTVMLVTAPELPPIVTVPEDSVSEAHVPLARLTWHSNEYPATRAASAEAGTEPE